MDRRTRLIPLYRLCLAIVILLASAACGPTEEVAPTAIAAATQAVPLATGGTAQKPACKPGSPDDPMPVVEIPWSLATCEDEGMGVPTPPYQPWYVPNHIVAIGPEADLDSTALLTENEVGIRLRRVLGDPIPLGYVNTALDEGCPELRRIYGPVTVDPLFLQLYRICGDASEFHFPEGSTIFGYPSVAVPIDVAAYLAFNYYGGLEGRQTRADLVYVTGPGKSWDLEGSPWTAMGSPWTAMGSPYDYPGGAAVAFQDQWALGTADGIGLVEEGQRTTSLCGRDVRVGVFDTAPIMQSQTIDLVQMSPPATIQAIYSAPNPPELEEPLDAEPVTDHGLAVAGLIHGVAPSSQIYLYRVLDDWARGDLATLNLAVHSFVQGVVVAKEDQAASGAVINLSLGIHPPQDRLARGLAGPLDWSDHGLSERLLVAMLDSVPDGVITLEILLAAADCHGIVVVAASGNEATSEMHPRPEIPARFASSLDVGAVDAARNLACFTNAGRLAAPGGNGVDPGCQPDPTGRSERYWLVVPVSTTSHAEGYAYWAGSSFAAPLVSGVVALAIENAGPVTVPPSWKLDGPVAGSMFDSLREARLDDDTDRDIPLDEIYLIDIGESLP